MDPAEANAIQQELMRQLAGLLKTTIQSYYGPDTGYALLIFPFGVPDESQSSGNYISNASRRDMIKALRDIADQIDAGEDMPPTIGSA